jgi:DNA-binding transcriptional MerR regulator
MPYTVKQLAKHSGVSSRTLHYYDEIGLLKPAYLADNNYRYYEEKQVLMLQQILFYKELKFPLSDIKKILNDDSFNIIAALRSHKNLLTSDLDRTRTLIETIDATITHLKGKTMIKLEEIFDGFTEEKQKMYEDFMQEQGVSRETIQQSKEKVKHWNKQQWLDNKADNDKVFADLAHAIESNLSPESEEVQAIIHRHYVLVSIFWQPTQDSYKALGQMYASHIDFVSFYRSIHPQLLDFLIASMTAYANTSLLH